MVVTGCDETESTSLLIRAYILMCISLELVQTQSKNADQIWKISLVLRNDRMSKMKSRTFYSLSWTFSKDFYGSCSPWRSCSIHDLLPWGKWKLKAQVNVCGPAVAGVYVDVHGLYYY